MTYTRPNITKVLVNEEEMNTRLTNLQALLRTILTDLDIEYTSSNTVIELIRLLERSYYAQIDGNADISNVQSLFSEHVVMRNVYDDDGDPNIQFLRTAQAPNFAFSYHPVSGGTGMVTAATLLAGKTLFQGYDNWTVEYDIIAPNPGYYETNRGMCVFFNDSTPVPSQSTYYGFSAGITIKSRKVYAFIGKWDNTLIPTYTYSENTLTAGETYHIKINCNNGNIDVNVTDASDNEVIKTNYNFYDDSFYRGGYNARVGTYADWQAYEAPLYGTYIGMKNILIDY